MPLDDNELLYHTPLAVNADLAIKTGQMLTNADYKSDVDTFNPHNEVLIFLMANRYYRANLYHLHFLSLKTSFQYAILAKTAYEDMIQGKKILPRVDNTVESATAMGWGDIFWLTTGEIINGLLIANGQSANVGLLVLIPLAYPFLIAGIVYFLTLSKLRERYRLDNQCEPSKAEDALIQEKAWIAGIQAFASVAGWELGYFLFELVIQSLFVGAAGTLFAPGGPLAHATAAIIVGLCAAIAIAIATAILLKEKNNGPLTKADWQMIAKVALCAFIAGALWWVFYSLPGFTGLASALGGDGLRGGNSGGEIFGYLFSSLLVFFSGIGTAALFSDQKEFAHTLLQKPGTSYTTKLLRWVSGTKLTELPNPTQQYIQRLELS